MFQPNRKIARVATLTGPHSGIDDRADMEGTIRGAGIGIWIFPGTRCLDFTRSGTMRTSPTLETPMQYIFAAMLLFAVLLGAFWALMLTALIVGGLFIGVVTPTETAILACVYAFIVGVFIYMGSTLREVSKTMLSISTNKYVIIHPGGAAVPDWQYRRPAAGFLRSTVVALVA